MTGKEQADDKECWEKGEEFGHAVVVTLQRVVRKSLSHKMTSEQDEAEQRSKSCGHPRILSTGNSRSIDLNMELYLPCSRNTMKNSISRNQ